MGQSRARLTQALDNNEFELYCQPVLALDAAGGYPMAEVLVRMREEERALLPPGEFLPVLEHYGMMPLLDRWVVRNTIQHLAAGSRIGAFSVNLAAQTLEDADFPRFVAAQLTSRKIPPPALAFEIDESDTLDRPEAAAKCAVACAALGCKVMIDSFGRRSIAFAAIKTFRAAYVKVDGTIVRNLLTSHAARTKMTAIVRAGKALGFSLIAEFVEEQDVLVSLKALGVGFAQGFGIHQPHPIGSFASAAGGALVTSTRPSAIA